MELDPTQLLTFAAILTAPTPIVAAAIRQIVETLKGLVPAIDAHWSGLRLSYAVAAVLAVLCFAFGTERDPTGGLACFWAWIAWSQASAGWDATLNQFRNRKDPGASEGIPDEPGDPPEEGQP